MPIGIASNSGFEESRSAFWDISICDTSLNRSGSKAISGPARGRRDVLLPHEVVEEVENRSFAALFVRQALDLARDYR